MRNYAWAIVETEARNNAPDLYSSKKKAEPVYNEIIKQIRENGWGVKEVSNKFGSWATIYGLEGEENNNISLERISIK